MVIAYVWQNVEVMNLRMTHQEALRARSALLTERDRLMYEIERGRTMEAVGEYAREHGYRAMTPADIEVISLARGIGKKK
jgi:hypothetical protein